MKLLQSWQHLGLRMLPRDTWSIAVVVGVGIAFGAFMAIADATVFHDIVPRSQAAMVATTSIFGRIVLFAVMAMVDELVFRLAIMSAIAWLLVSMAGKQDWCFWTAILIVALLAYPVLHPAYLATIPVTSMAVARELILHGGAGILWGYLYWRYGLIAAIAGHVGAHLSLQPLLTLLA